MGVKFFGVFFVLTTLIFSQSIDSTNYSISLSTNLYNSFTVSRAENSFTYKANPSFDLGFEFIYLNKVGGDHEGVGVQLQPFNSIIGVNGNYINLPVYIFYDKSFSEENKLYIPKLSLRLGYNIFIQNDDFMQHNSEFSNGIYLALGVTSQFDNHFNFRILYTLNQGKLSYAGKEYLINNQNIKLELSVLLPY